jgi:hypothetical protein
MTQLTKAQIEANLEAKVGRLPGEDTKAFILRKQNEATLYGQQKRDAQTEITRQQVEARIAALDAKRELDREKKDTEKAEAAKLAAENPFRDALNTTEMNKSQRKRFVELAEEKDAVNESRRKEQERVATLVNSEPYKLAERMAAQWVDVLPDEFKQEGRNQQAILAETLDYDGFYTANKELIARVRQSLDSASHDVAVESVTVQAKVDELTKQRGVIDALSPPETEPTHSE